MKAPVSLPDRFGPQLSNLPETESVQATCVFALELANGAWIARPKSDATPGVWFDESLERSFLFDDRGRSIRLRDISDYPTIVGFSPDHRFVWVEDKHGSGGVFRTRDGALVTMRPGTNDNLGGLPRLTAAGALAVAREGSPRTELRPRESRTPFPPPGPPADP